MAGDAAVGAGRPSRRSAAASSSAGRVVKSTGGIVDAARLEIDDIAAALAQQNQKYLGAVDFVDLPDAALETLFVTERVRARQKELLYPPMHYRRTVDQIRHWFNTLGKGEKRSVMEKEASYEIVRNHEELVFDDVVQAWELPAPPDEEVEDEEAEAEPCKCRGVCMDYISDKRYDIDRRDVVLLGFKHTVREGYTTRAAMSNPNPAEDEWSFAPPVVGAIRDGNTSNVRWVVEEHARDVGSDQFEHHSIYHVDCTRGEDTNDRGLCKACADVQVQKSLFRRFDSHVDLREGEFDPKTRHTILERSGSLMKRSLKYHQRESKNKSKKIARRDAVIDRLLEETGVDVKVNKHSNFVFNASNEKAVKEFLQKELGPESIAEYAFERSVRNHEVAKNSGAKAVRHCPLMIRLGMAVKRKMGYAGGLFDLVGRIAGWPSSRQLRRYAPSSSNEEDGILHGNCKRARDEFKKKNKDAGRLDYHRHTVLSFDSMTCKGRFAVSRNTNELVAVEENCFEDEVVLNELKALEKNASGEEEAEMKLPGIAKHFLVFIATTWSADTKAQFLVARYGVTSVQAPFLVRTIRELIHGLISYGFIVDQVAGDGAPENRSAFKKLAKITAGELLEGAFTEDELRGLPLSFKVAFRHPHPLYEDDIIVTIGGEMPHWVKKFRNAFDSKARNLVFRGKPMSLEMLYEMWEESGDADVTGGASLRKYRFTHDHFNLNSYLKMRVFLAVQIPSQTMIQMIKDHCKSPVNLAKLEDYEPMIELFNAVDRLVDIMNGIGYKRKNRDVELINSPKHRHIGELFDILLLFEEWKVLSGGYTEKFVTNYTYEDLMWMVFGVAGAAKLYMKEDGSRTMHQGRHGTDVCEHFFSQIRYINSNPTMQQAREGASAIGSGIAMHGRAFQADSKANSSSAPKASAAELLAPIERADNEKRPAKRQKTS